MSEEEIVKKKTILDKHISDKWDIFIGDCEIVNQYLENKSQTAIWVLLQFFNALTRSFGQVIFANNPISGLLIMAAVGVADYRALLAALTTASLAFLFALALRQDPGAVYSGAFGYNAVLHGIVSVSVLPALYPQVSVGEPKFWLFLSLATLLSIYLTSASMNFCRHLGQYPVPCFTISFNFVQYILIFCLLHNSVPARILSNDLIEAPTANVESAVGIELLGKPDMELAAPSNASNGTHLNWGRVFSGTIVSMSQIYGLNDVLCSVLMFLGLVVYSPTTAAFGYLGGLLGTILGQLFATDVEEVYNGVWGYNCLLISGALAGFCFVLTVHSVVLAFSAVLFTLAFQHFTTPLFISLGVPMLSVPFNIASLAFNLVTAEGRSLVRPLVYSYPEKHRQQMLGSAAQRRALTRTSKDMDKWSDFGEV